jgi:hypothetical protein
MGRVVHFDIEASDPDRAMAFYRDVLGWEFEKWDGPMDYWMVYTGSDDDSGINGGLAKRDGSAPATDAPAGTYTCTVDVDDVEATVASVLEQGGSVVQDVHPVPGAGWLAYCADTEGNRFGVMQMDEAAA